MLNIFQEKYRKMLFGLLFKSNPSPLIQIYKHFVHLARLGITDQSYCLYSLPNLFIYFFKQLDVLVFDLQANCKVNPL